MDSFLQPVRSPSSFARWHVNEGYVAYESGDLPAALETWARAAKSGDAEALFLVGTMYATGAGIRQDFNVAYAHLMAATVRGNWRAAFNAALLGLRDPPPSSPVFVIRPTMAVALLRLTAQWTDDDAIRQRALQLEGRLKETLPAAADTWISAAIGRIKRYAEPHLLRKS